MDKLVDKTNIVGGGVIALLSVAFGQFWFLFAGFLFANIIDWLSGWAAAKKEGNESSSVGARGIAKKVWYWVVIAIAFYISFSFEQMGTIINIDLSFLNMFGWFVLANYMVNEIRSILENLTRLDVKLPAFLVTGLKIANDMIDKAGDKFVNDDKEGEKK